LPITGAIQPSSLSSGSSLILLFLRSESFVSERSLLVDVFGSAAATSVGCHLLVARSTSMPFASVRAALLFLREGDDMPAASNALDLLKFRAVEHTPREAIRDNVQRCVAVHGSPRIVRLIDAATATYAMQASASAAVDSSTITSRVAMTTRALQSHQARQAGIAILAVLLRRQARS
jgi:hypothetical protein